MFPSALLPPHQNLLNAPRNGNNPGIAAAAGAGGNLMTPASRRPGPHYITVVTIAVVVVELCCGWCCVVELCCCGCPCVVNGNNYTMVLQIITTPPHCCPLPGPGYFT